jgi:hypothetical protein
LNNKASALAKKSTPKIKKLSYNIAASCLIRLADGQLLSEVEDMYRNGHKQI